MKWITKAQKDGIDLSKVGKKLTEKINKYKEDEASLKEIQASKSSLSENDLAEYEKDVASIEQGLEVLNKEICADLDRYVANKDVNAARVIKMQEGRAKALEAKKAAKPAGAPIIATTPTPAPPTDKTVVAPAQQQPPLETGGVMEEVVETKEDEPKEEKKKGKGIGYWIAAIAIVALTAGAAAKILKDRQQA